MEKTIVVSNEEMFSNVTRWLEDGHTVTINVKGRSMLPFIVEGRDLVTLQKADSYAKDDIVLFCLKGTWILHRIIEVHENKFIIRGDGIQKNTESCTPGQIKGKAVCILRNGRKEINPYGKSSILKLRLWNAIRPLRRYILYAWRHAPWMRKYFKAQR